MQLTAEIGEGMTTVLKYQLRRMLQEMSRDAAALSITDVYCRLPATYVLWLARTIAQNRFWDVQGIRSLLSQLPSDVYDTLCEILELPTAAETLGSFVLQHWPAIALPVVPGKSVEVLLMTVQFRFEIGGPGKESRMVEHAYEFRCPSDGDSKIFTEPEILHAINLSVAAQVEDLLENGVEQWYAKALTNHVSDELPLDLRISDVLPKAQPE